ncbi:hypothetical protein PIB30_075410 [Stylosanthes scabra]|uniref:Uncharacterized protein n=1 Tax=Stylosanthes scabra TaxID=79078 RepID=A0ABU6SQH6_9FABA|nr:hypothetical protein [Stylosanthes scabra]
MQKMSPMAIIRSLINSNVEADSFLNVRTQADYNGLYKVEKLKKGSLQIKKRNLEAKQSKAPCICIACCSYPNPRLSQPTTLRRGNLLLQCHAYA